MPIDFIDYYVNKYHSEITDASKKYAEAISYALLGFALGRSGRINLTPREIYTNFFIIILGDSTVSRKSTAIMDVAYPLLPEDDILPNNYSPESLYDKYADNPHRILLEAEFSKVLKKARRRNSHMSHIVEDFEQIYDCPPRFSSDTRSHRNVEARNLFLSIVGATTPTALMESLNEEMLHGGFYPRFLIVWEQNPNPRPRKVLPDDLNERRMILEIYLKKLRCSNFMFTFQPTNALFNWETGVMREDPEATAIIGRYSTYIIKVSAILALNEYIRENDFPDDINNMAASGILDSRIQQIIEHNKSGNEMRFSNEIEIFITNRHYEQARDWISKILADAKEIRQMVSEERILGKLLRVMRGKSKLRHSDWLRKTGLKARDFKEGIETLVDQRTICRVPEDNIMHYCIANRSKCAECRLTNQSSEYMLDDDE